MLNPKIEEKWQELVNMMANAFDMPAGFIVRHTEDGYEVLIASDGPENPYKAGGIIPEDTNIFCRKVVKENRTLQVFDATQQPEWQTNPEVADDGFNTYIGFPVKYPDNNVFGTICVMDFKPHPLNDKYLDVIAHFRSVVELDLVLLDELEKVTDLSLRDDLTGLYNRRGFNLISRQHMHFVKRASRYFIFLIIDIDLLKTINDTHGHTAGDETIIHVADALKHSCRSSDLIARVGGDEFFVALYVNDTQHLHAVVSRINSYLAEHPPAFGPVTVSCGYAIREFSQEDPIQMDVLLEEADKMLYAKKHARTDLGR